MYTPFTHEELHERFEKIREMQKKAFDKAMQLESNDNAYRARAILNDMSFGYENEISAHERLNMLRGSAAPKEV